MSIEPGFSEVLIDFNYLILICYMSYLEHFEYMERVSDYLSAWSSEAAYTEFQGV